MIGVNGQFIAKFNVGNIKDFINGQDLINFSMWENAGNQLPVFELEFNYYDNDILPYLNQNGYVDCSCGEDLDSLQDIKLMINLPEITTDSTQSYKIKLTGYVGSNKYIEKTNRKIYRGNSKQVLSEIANNNLLTFKSNVLLPRDSMNWIQCNQSDKEFADNICEHSDINGLPALAISWNQEMIFNDLFLSAKFPPTTYIQEKKPLAGNWIVAEPSIDIVDGTAYLNSLSGHNNSISVVDIDTLETEKIEVKTTPFLANTSNENINKELSTLQIGHIRNINQHKTFDKIELKNKNQLIQLSRFKVSLVIKGQALKCKLLDIVSFLDKELNNKQAEENHSGLYAVIMRNISIQKNEVFWQLTLSRESSNKIRNT